MARNWMLGRDERSGSWVARKQIPAKLRAAYAAAFGKGWAEKFARPATLNEHEARIAFAEWLAAVESRIHFVAAGMRGDGTDLTHVQAHALAGRWYRWKTARHYDDPGSADRWSGEIKALVSGIAGLLPKDASAKPDLSGSASTTTPERFEDLVDKLGDAQAKV